MKCFFITASVILGLCLEIGGEINSEFRNLYCVDPHTGVYYPVHSTWPSSTFCGTYTCNVRGVSEAKKNSLKTKETYLKENIENGSDETSIDEEEESYDEREELTDTFKHVNLSNPEETIKLYKAAKHLLNALDNKDKHKHENDYKKSDMSNLKYDYYSKKSNKYNNEKRVINLSTKQLELLFDAANGLVIQLEEKLNEDQSLSETNHRDLEKLLDVSHKISHMTEKEIKNNNDDPKSKTEIHADPKLMEYLDEYNKYMQEYQKVYSNYLTKNGNQKTCDVIKGIVSDAKDCEVSPSEISQMYYYFDKTGNVQKIAVPKYIESDISIPGTLIESDDNYNYWNLEVANDNEDKNNADKTVLKRETGNAANNDSANIYNYVRYGYSHGDFQHNQHSQHSQQTNLQHLHSQHNKASSNQNEMYSHKVLMEKYEKAMAAYTDYYNYYNRKTCNTAPVECPTEKLALENVNTATTTEKQEIPPPLNQNAYFINGIKTTTQKSITVIPTTPVPEVTTEDTVTATDAPEISISTIEPKIDERSSEDKGDELFKKLSYYTYDPNTKQYVMKTPKDDEEYQRYLKEYYELMNSTRTEEKHEDSIPDGSSISERFNFLKLNKRFPSIKGKLEFDNPKKNVRFSDSYFNAKYPTHGAEIIEKPIVKEEDIVLKFEDQNSKEPNFERNAENNDPFPGLFDQENNRQIVTDNVQVKTAAEMNKFTTERYPKVHPTVSYYNYDPISGKYVLKTPKDTEEYEKFLKEYQEVTKHYHKIPSLDNDEGPSNREEALTDSSNIKERIMRFGEKSRFNIPNGLLNQNLKEFKENFDSFVHLKYSPVSTLTIDTPIVKEDDIVLNMDRVPEEMSKFSSNSNDGKFDFPSFGRRLRRSLRKVGRNRRAKRWEAFITVKGCPETLEPGVFKHGDTEKFYPACCPQIIN